MPLREPADVIYNERFSEWLADQRATLLRRMGIFGKMILHLRRKAVEMVTLRRALCFGLCV